MTDTEIVFKIRAETDQLSVKLKKAEAEIKRLQKQMMKTKEAKTAVDQTTRSFATLATHIAKIVAIYATFEGLSSAVKAMGDFEQKMKEVGVVAGASADEFVSLNERAKSLGENTQFSATQVAGAMKQMAMSGMKVDDIYTAIGDVLNLAAATMTDLGDSAQIVTTIMNAYHLQASDINDVTDALAKTTTNSATTLEELGRAFAKVGPVANQLGVSVEETSAMLGVLADNGRRGAEAGTQLKIVMERLASNSEAKKGLDAIGVSAYDAGGKLKDMTQIMVEVKEGLKNLHNTAEANRIASVIFGEEAKSSAIALMNNLDKVGNKFKEIQLAMRNDFAGAAAKKMMDTMSGSWKKFKSALEGVALTIGETLIPVLRDAIDDFTEFLGGLDPEVLRGFGSVLGNLAKSLETTIKFVLDFAARLIAFGQDFPTATAAVANFAGAVAALLTLRSVSSFLTSNLGPAVKYLGTTFAMIAEMVAAGGPLMIGLAALAAVLATLYTRQQMLNVTFGDAAAVMDKMSTQYGNVIDLLQVVQNEVNKYGAAQKSTVEKVKTAIKSLLPAYEKEIKALERRYDLNEAQKKELASLEGQYKQLQYRLKKLGKIETFKNLTTDTKALSSGVKLTKKQLEEAQKVADKFYNSYKIGVTGANNALDRLIGKEISLKVKLAELIRSKLKIEQDAANARLEINKSINEQIFQTSIQTLSKYDKAIAEESHKEQRMREALANFEKALHKGRIDLAKKYAAEYTNVVSSLDKKEYETANKFKGYYENFTDYKIKLLNKARDLQIKAINAEEAASKKANDEKIALMRKQLAAVKTQIKATEVLIAVMEKLYDQFANKHLFNPDQAKADIAKIKDMTTSLNADMKQLNINIKTDAAVSKAKEAGLNISHIISQESSKGVIKPKIDTKSISDSLEAGVKAAKPALNKLEDIHPKITSKITFDRDSAETEVVSLIDQIEARGPAVDIPIELISQSSFKQALTNLLILYKNEALGIRVEPEKIDEAKAIINDFIKKASDEKIAPDLDSSKVIEKVKAAANFIAKVDPTLTLYANDKNVKAAQTNAKKPLESTLLIKADARTSIGKRNELAKPIKTVNNIIVKADAPERKRVELSKPIETKLIVKTDDKLKKLQKPITSTLKIKTDLKTANAAIAKLKEETQSTHHVKIDADHALAVINQLKHNTFSTHTVYVKQVQMRASGGLIYNYASGGRVPGYDPTDSDKVPAMLTAGEYVFNRKTVDRLGVGFLDMINNGMLPQFAEGGGVSTGGSAPVSLQPINLHIGNRSFQAMAATEVASALERYLTTEGGL